MGGNDEDDGKKDRNYTDNTLDDTNITKSDEEKQIPDEDDADDEKLCKQLHSTRLHATLDPHAPAKIMLSTIDETKADVIKNKSKSKFVDITGPGKVRISKQFTNNIIPQKIREDITNLYHYMNKSLIFLQIKLYPDNINNLCIINYDFHDKVSNEYLYCIIIKTSNDIKYAWKMEDKLYTNIEIEKLFAIRTERLPKPVRVDKHFKRQLTSITRNDLQSEIIQKIINETKWHDIPVYSKVNNRERAVLYLSTTEFRNKLKHYIDINVVNIIKDNVSNYWIEHVWIVQISNNVTIGISLQLDTVKHAIKVTGIHLNKEYISKAHILTPYHNCHCLDNFVSFFDDLKIGDIDRDKNIHKQLKREVNNLMKYKQKYYKLKQFIYKTANSSGDLQLVREADEILNSVTSPITHTDIIAVEEEIEDKKQDRPSSVFQFCNNPITISTSQSQDSMMNPMATATLAMQNACLFPQPVMLPMILPNLPLHTQTSLSGMSSYSSPSLTAMSVPIVSSKSFALKDRKKGIYISKTFTNKYFNELMNIFNDSKQLFYYLNQSIYMQINDLCAHMYCNKLVIVNLDLCDTFRNNLYAIIQINNNEVNKHKFQWEMIKLCNAPKIFEEYHINIDNLPQSSRNNSAFISELEKHKNIKLTESIINGMNFRLIRVIKNKSRGNSKVNKQPILISESKIRQYLLKSLQNKIQPIPIVKIKENNHWIEAVMICQVPGQNVNFGVSFKCNENNIIEATCIFLDKIDIENQNKLTGETVSIKVLDQFVSGISKMIIQ